MLKKDLNNPIETKPARPPKPPRRPIVTPLVISLALVLAVVAAFWVAVVDDPDGGRPVASAPIENAVPNATGSVGSQDAGITTDTQIASASPNIEMPVQELQQPPRDQENLQLASLPQLPPALIGDPSLLEYSNSGPLPRISPDGRRPRDIYARRSSPVPEGVPRIVIVVGGLGLSQTGTQSAIEALPEEVTLAFAPYGSSLQRWVAKARERGHEVLLQVPLEPQNYPEENPGEHTLLVSGGSSRQDLHWVLGRMTAYAGVMNYMGSRFTGDERALVPFLGEIGERGLFYLDDGTSPQSMATSVGEALKVPVLKADRVLDAKRSAAAIEKELDALEAVARVSGLAIGVASAFPQTVEAISRWTDAATERGIIIVPASAAVDS
jgi:polysaccharide deacetylase 2 family uncharacterized protein YibQ